MRQGKALRTLLLIGLVEQRSNVFVAEQAAVHRLCNDGTMLFQRGHRSLHDGDGLLRQGTRHEALLIMYFWCIYRSIYMQMEYI